MGRGLALYHEWLKVRALPCITSFHHTHLLIPKEIQVPRKEPEARGPIAISVQELSLTSSGAIAKAQTLVSSSLKPSAK